jgi:glycosyltransferase involved in cell wall biosynthesis
LYKKKGLEDLMVALGWMRSQGAPPFRLVLIVGQGGAMESVVPDWLSKTIADQHLTNVVSARGFVNDRAELAKHYSQADVFILPSWSEGFPRVVDEAMSFGVPVVATTVGGIPEVLEDGRDALLVKPRRPIDLGKTLLDLLSSNDETRRKLGAAGRRSYESRVRETAAKQQARLIREVWARKCNSLV